MIYMPDSPARLRDQPRRDLHPRRSPARRRRHCPRHRNLAPSLTSIGRLTVPCRGRWWFRNQACRFGSAWRRC